MNPGSPDDSGGPVRILRQRQPSINRFGSLLLLAILVWPFLGFAVYWLRTGETAIRAGTITDLGGVVWFGPFFAGFAVLTVGPLGPLRRLYVSPWIVRLDASGASWGRPDEAGRRAEWTEIAGAATGGFRSETFTVLRSMQGDELIRFNGMTFRDERTGTDSQLPGAIVALRPDRYELVKGSMLKRGDAAVLRLSELPIAVP